MSWRNRCHLGDCLDVMRSMPANSVDSIVSDPPYGLSDHKSGEIEACLRAWLDGQVYSPKGAGFMGKAWDAWVPGPEVWRAAFTVLKPGGHMLIFAGTRSMDLVSMAIRLAGFELRDAIGYAHDGGGAPLAAWCYGSGFPKSLDVGKAIDRAAGAKREVIGRYTIPKDSAAGNAGKVVQSTTEESGMFGATAGVQGTPITAPATEAARQWQGWGTALKPAWEPVIIARKPLDQGTVAANVLHWGTGGLNIDACRVELHGDYKCKANGRPSLTGLADHYEPATANKADTLGRWPANLILDGSDEVLAAFPDATGQQGALTGNEPSDKTADVFGAFAGRAPSTPRGDTGSAARFFYCAKAGRKERNDGLPIRVRCTSTARRCARWKTRYATAKLQATPTPRSSRLP